MTEVEDLTVAEALGLILKSVSVLPGDRLPLLSSLGLVLSEPIIAHDNLPPFRNSAMDGYAVRAEDVTTASAEQPVQLRVIGDIAAGVLFDEPLTRGTSTRIMTGAPLPEGADAIVPVEDTDEPWRDANRPLPETIAISRRVTSGLYVRDAGEDIKRGETVLEAGLVIRPQEISLLAALGNADVGVVRRPRVGILSTGDELVDVDSQLAPGMIRNSNSYALAAQATEAGAEPVFLGIAGDTEESVRTHLAEGLEAQVDLFVSTAGVSVGAYDVVKNVLETDGGVKFWRVRMRPGKPLAFGQYQGKPYLGIPGNPVSAAVSFERFARPALLKMAGHTHLERPLVQVTLTDSISSDGRESYIRAYVRREGAGYVATTSGGQGSHMISALVRANALVIVPESMTSVSAGSTLPAMMIDWPNRVL